MIISPIAIFLYNNYYYVDEIIDKIVNSKKYLDRDIYCYIDYPDDDVAKYANTIIVAKLSFYKKKFKKIIIKQRTSKYGLSGNIVCGISEVLNQNKSVIVLEDDIIPTENFLEYHDYFLTKYQHSNVFHISSFTFKNTSTWHFSRHMECWGWSTWSDKWEKFVKYDLNNIYSLKKEKYLKINNLFIRDNLGILEKSQIDHKDVWAIHWEISILNNNGFCLLPPSPIVRIGKKNNSANSDYSNYSDNYRHEPNIIVDDKYSFIFDIQYVLSNSRLNQFIKNTIKQIYEYFICKLFK